MELGHGGIDEERNDGKRSWCGRLLRCSIFVLSSPRLHIYIYLREFRFVIMPWKEFLAPTPAKLIVFFFVFPVLFFAQTVVSLWASTDQAMLGNLSLALAVIAQPFIFVGNYLPTTAPLLSAIATLLASVSDFGYWYLLSCAVVRVFGGLKRNFAEKRDSEMPTV